MANLEVVAGGGGGGGGKADGGVGEAGLVLLAGRA